jgi:hypothetical protein
MGATWLNENIQRNRTTKLRVEGWQNENINWRLSMAKTIDPSRINCNQRLTQVAYFNWIIHDDQTVRFAAVLLHSMKVVIEKEEACVPTRCFRSTFMSYPVPATILSVWIHSVDLQVPCNI